MQFGQPAIWLFKLLSISLAYTGISDWDACSGRLERALDALHRDSTRRNKLDEEEAGTLYQRELHSAPLQMSVSRIAVKVILLQTLRFLSSVRDSLDAKRISFLLIKYAYI